MARYYLDGYTPPAGVNSASSVKEYQRRLGVKADGIWGPDTEAAYRASLNTGSAGSAGSTGSTAGTVGTPGYAAPAESESLFNSYFSSIMNSLSVPEVTVQAPSISEVRSMWSEALRPSADAAIEKRNKAAQREMAEIDADAVSRGMGSSSYVTSVKAREMEEAQDDIADIEARYGAALAEKIYDTLQSYDQLGYSARKYNAEAGASAQKAALSMASDWYSSYLANQRAEQTAKSSAAAKAASASSGTKKSKGSGLSADDYAEYIRNLSQNQRKQLFNSESSYWSSRRDEIYSALGKTLYDSLKKKYGG